MDWLFKHKFAALIIILAMAGMAWYVLSGSSSSSSSVLSSESVASVPPDAQALVQSLSTLRAVALTGDIFTNPAFGALQDYSTPIIPEPVGRSDPFAPLSASGITSTSTLRAKH